MTTRSSDEDSGDDRKLNDDDDDQISVSSSSSFSASASGGAESDEEETSMVQWVGTSWNKPFLDTVTRVDLVSYRLRPYGHMCPVMMSMMPVREKWGEVKLGS
ncbi:hypothetical protein Q3G72_005681 [Acer saccharum]|nr:hypothetical protein Q3G72_005681 [Acer saccharum]